MTQHGAVGLIQDGRRHVNHQVRIDADEMAIECRMVEFAEREAVRNDGLAAWMPVRQDMRGFQELLVAESTDCAAFAISRENALTKALLVQSLARVAGDVLPPSVRLHCLLDTWPEVKQPRIIDRNLEGQRSGIIANDVNGPDCEITPRHQAIQVDEWSLTLHRQPKPGVIGVFRICAAIPVEDGAALLYAILVWSLPTFDDGHRRYRERHLGCGRFEDALRADERHAATVEHKSAAEDLAGQDLSVQTGLFLQECECCGSDTTVSIRDRHVMEDRRNR